MYVDIIRSVRSSNSLIWSRSVFQVASFFLVNNLDLAVVDEANSVTYLGNAPLYPAADRLNNVEQVTIENSGSSMLHLSLTGM